MEGLRCKYFTERKNRILDARPCRVTRPKFAPGNPSWKLCRTIFPCTVNYVDGSSSSLSIQKSLKWTLKQNAGLNQEVKQFSWTNSDGLLRLRQKILHSHGTLQMKGNKVKQIWRTDHLSAGEYVSWSDFCMSEIIQNNLPNHPIRIILSWKVSYATRRVSLDRIGKRTWVSRYQWLVQEKMLIFLGYEILMQKRMRQPFRNRWAI